MKKTTYKVSRLSGFKAAVFGTLATSLVSVSGLSAEELRYSIPQSDGNAVTKAIVRYIDYLNANSDLEAKQYGAALLNQGEVSGGLRDGIVGMGFVVTGYLPAEFSEMNLMANLSMLATSGAHADSPAAASSGAMMEYVLFNCPECLVEFSEQNQVFLSSGSTNSYDLLCADPIRTLADMKGRKFRSGAANFGRWAESVGATKVSMSSTEVFDAMSQGVLDCNMLSVGDIVSNGLLDVVKTALLGVPGGVYSGFGTNNVNKDVWAAMSVEQRTVAINGAAGLAADIVIIQQENLEAATAAAIEAGIEIIQADAELQEATLAFVHADLAIITEQFTSQYGVEEAAAKVELSASLIERWKGLTNGIVDDRTALEELFQREIFSKLDPATYGLD